MKLTPKQYAKILVDLCQENQNDLDSAIKGFISFLADRKELHKINEIVRKIDPVWKEIYGVSTISVETAVPINQATKQKLIEIAAGAEIKESVNPDVIGGMRLRIDDRLIDGTIQGKLMHLKRTLNA